MTFQDIRVPQMATASEIRFEQGSDLRVLTESELDEISGGFACGGACIAGAAFGAGLLFGSGVAVGYHAAQD